MPPCSTNPPVLCINLPGSFTCGPCPIGQCNDITSTFLSYQSSYHNVLIILAESMCSINKVGNTVRVICSLFIYLFIYLTISLPALFLQWTLLVIGEWQTLLLMRGHSWVAFNSRELSPFCCHCFFPYCFHLVMFILISITKHFYKWNIVISIIYSCWDKIDKCLDKIHYLKSLCGNGWMCVFQW